MEVAIDWKSDVNVTPTVRAGYVRQLQEYLSATGANRGAVVFMSLGEITWVEHAAALPAIVSVNHMALSPGPNLPFGGLQGQ